MTKKHLIKKTFRPYTYLFKDIATATKIHVYLYSKQMFDILTYKDAIWENQR
jgi:hypothetical protein